MKRNLELKIAYWYYTLKLTQDEIAKRAGTTRQKVNQTIRSLEAQGIVSISIHGFERDHIELESRLEEAYGLNEVLVVSDYGEKDTVVNKVANVAAQFLEEIISPGTVIGVSWGSTLAETIDQMGYHPHPSCRVLQLLGSQQNTTLSAEKADEITRNLANRLDCPSHIIYAPAIVEHEETREWLMREESIQVAFSRMEECDIALVGVGELTKDSTLCKRGHLTEKEIRALRKQGFVADVVLNPVRADGSTDNCSLSGRLIATDIDCLKRIANTVVVAAGEKKAGAVRAVLKSGCVNTAIIDESMARLLL